jgi:hypothetical protein
MTRDLISRYESSHIGYSWLGQLITWGTVPWFVVILEWSPFSKSAVGKDANLVLALAFAVVWLVGKAAGPERLRWFYRRPGSCTFSPDSFEWRTEMPFRAGRITRVEWKNVSGIEIRSLRFSIVGSDNEVHAQLDPDILRLRPEGLREDLTFAQALVSYRPDDYVLTDPRRYGVSAGARRRNRDEPRSVVAPRTLSRSTNVALVVYVVVIFVVGFLETALQH